MANANRSLANQALEEVAWLLEPLQTIDTPEQVLALLRPPDLVVYLRRRIDGLLENIRLRGRDYEHDIPRDYLERLNRYYEDWIFSRPSERVLVVEADDLDFIARNADLVLLLQWIQEAAGQQELFSVATDSPAADPRFRLLIPPWSKTRHGLD